MTLDEMVSKVRESGAQRVMVQIPEGLRTRAVEILDALAAADVEAVLSNDPCYGACDLADKEAAQMKCDALLHVGHNEFYRDFDKEVPVIYYPWPVDIDISRFDLSGIKEKRVAIATSIQHTKFLGELRSALESAGKEVRVAGQALGCYASELNNVDAYVFVGSGDFHPLALKGKVYIMDIERNEVRELDAKKHEKRRWGRILKAKDARTFGILVSSKGGQFELLGKAREIKKRLEEKHKKAYILTMEEINQSRLDGLKLDAFVNTACPRITDDVFEKPVINAGDIDEILVD